MRLRFLGNAEVLRQSPETKRTVRNVSRCFEALSCPLTAAFGDFPTVPDYPFGFTADFTEPSAHSLSAPHPRTQPAGPAVKGVGARRVYSPGHLSRRSERRKISRERGFTQLS